MTTNEGMESAHLLYTMGDCFGSSDLGHNTLQPVQCIGPSAKTLEIQDEATLFCSRDCCLCTKHQSVKKLRHAGSKGKNKHKENHTMAKTKHKQTKPTTTQPHDFPLQQVRQKLRQLRSWSSIATSGRFKMNHPRNRCSASTEPVP